ncbi:ABC transporter family protein [Halanaerobium sp. MA284_MarDTE_T2]|nr:ATP-binding cassette domain-containing protein [Halanaerobium sp. MA284_MarDTE_T2]RCW49288.1 ABC transporter family protein [Halanaerobium sp. MA284_MarDTE_T2]
MSLIEVNEVSYIYENDDNEKPALKDVSINIESGDFIAVIGSNGSGKSTLAKLLNVLLLPSEGDILVNGLNSRDKKIPGKLGSR